MYDGYLALGGTEILNRARAAAYLQEFLGGRVQIKCDDAGLRTGLGHGKYTTPAANNAPWMAGGSVAGGRFLGLFPGKVVGAEDSTRQLEVTELTGSGAVMTSPRYESHEIRFVATAYAMDAEAMEEGMAWLKEALANDGCSDALLGCTGREAKLFTAMPSTSAQATSFTRIFHRVEVTEGPKVTKKFPTTSRGFVMWEVDFTLTAGIPWMFTALADAGAVNMDTASNFQDPKDEDCNRVPDAYNSYVDDPYFTGINRPPRPPIILPPNILAISSWRRHTVNIPAVQTDHWGRVVPVVSVSTTTAVQFLRLRFYQSGKAGCDFEGEFIVSYIPAKTMLFLDAIKREISMRLPDGRTVPAGHLIFGSNGRPFLWPSLGCQRSYRMTADLMPGQTGVAVVLQTAVRN